jgi:hypothetical protein
VNGLLDEQLSPHIATLLRQRGFDIEAVADRPDLVGRSDLVIFAVACDEDRAVITNNVKDFRPLAAQWLAQGRVHAGLILLPSSGTRTRAALAMLADRIAAVLGDSPDGLASSERWIRPLPACVPTDAPGVEP